MVLIGIQDTAKESFRQHPVIMMTPHQKKKLITFSDLKHYFTTINYNDKINDYSLAPENVSRHFFVLIVCFDCCLFAISFYLL